MADGDSLGQMCEKVDEAFGSWFAAHKGSGLGGVSIYEGMRCLFDETDLQWPLISIMSNGADPMEEDPNYGNFDVDVTIQLEVDATQDKFENYRNWGGVITNMLYRGSDLPVALNALGQSDFTAYLWTPGRIERDKDGNKILKTWHGTLKVHPSD